MIALKLPLVVPFSLAFVVHTALAQVVVSDAWIRGTVAGQRTTGAFMRLSSATDQTLVAVSSPAAVSVEIHEMTMEQGVMKMRAIDKLAIHAGQTVDLKSGGYHLMLQDLRATLKAGDTVPMSLTWQDGSGKKMTQDVAVLVKLLTATSDGAHKH